MISKLYTYSDECTVPYTNLALEHFFMRSVPEGAVLLYLWRNRRTVVVGRNQNSRRECRVDELRADGGFLARRLSGGGAVYHDLGNLNFSFLASQPDYDVARQLSVICRAIGYFGLKAEVSGRNDIMAEGRKCSGNAFLQEGARHCHHGTLLISVRAQEMMQYLTPDPVKLQSKGVASVKARVCNLAELEPAVTVQSLSDALVRAFGEVYGLVPQPFPPQDIDTGAVLREAAFLHSSDWLFGHDPAASAESECRRFSWGCAELRVTVRPGAVTGAVLETDALDPQLSQKVCTALTGAAFDRGSLARALQNAAFEPGLQADLQLLTEDLF